MIKSDIDAISGFINLVTKAKRTWLKEPERSCMK